MSAKLNKRQLASLASRVRIIEFIGANIGVTRGEISDKCGTTESLAYAALSEFVHAGLVKKTVQTRGDCCGVEHLWHLTSVVVPEMIIAIRPAPKVCAPIPVRVVRQIVRDPWDVALFGQGPARVTDYDALREVAA